VAVPGITINNTAPEWGSVETIIYEAMQNYIELDFWKARAARRNEN
jgi:hypothetical protein